MILNIVNNVKSYYNHGISHKQFKWDIRMLQIAESMSNESKCQSRHVCAIATKNNRIIATGINGTISGFQNCSQRFPNGVNESNREEHHAWSQLYEAHAEDNLIAEFAKNQISSIGSTVYINLHPCEKCTIRLAGIGVTRIVYSIHYDKANTDYTKEIFAHSNIKFSHIKI